MKRELFDLVVIGAGPAGSAAAQTASEAGLRVAILERRQEIGSPVRCGEILLEIDALRQELGDDPSWLTKTSRGLDVTVGDHTVNVESDVGVVRREQLDKLLLKKAVASGAELYLKFDVSTISKGSGSNHGVHGAYWGKKIELQSSSVIIAAGADYIDDRNALMSLETSDFETGVRQSREFCVANVVAEEGAEPEESPGLTLTSALVQSWRARRGDRSLVTGICRRPSSKTSPWTEWADQFGSAAGDRCLEKTAGVFVFGPRSRVIHEGALLTGSLIGCMDPLSLQGFHLSREAGKRAGTAIAATGEADGGRDEYEAWWKNESIALKRRLALRAQLAHRDPEWWMALKPPEGRWKDPGTLLEAWLSRDAGRTTAT